MSSPDGDLPACLARLRPSPAGDFGRQHRRDRGGKRCLLRRCPALEHVQVHNAFALARLARFKLPRNIRIVASLPRTASGKVKRRDLA
jgi:acyl-CoA synthetase (AMP-forming)/AMP-acid ligase II